MNHRSSAAPESRLIPAPNHSCCVPATLHAQPSSPSGPPSPSPQSPSSSRPTPKSRRQAHPHRRDGGVRPQARAPPSSRHDRLRHPRPPLHPQARTLRRRRSRPWACATSTSSKSPNPSASTPPLPTIQRSTKPSPSSASPTPPRCRPPSSPSSPSSPSPTPTSPSRAPTSSRATSTASTSTTSPTPPKPPSSPRSSAPAARATSPSTATSSSCPSKCPTAASIAAPRDSRPNPSPPTASRKPHHIPVAQRDRFRGVRIFDISDIRNPRQVAAVQTCRGSHTHTLVVDPNDKDNVYLYVSGTSFVRRAEELAGCSGETPDKDPNTALFRIDVIKVPLATPQDAKVVSSPRVFVDPRTGALNGLNNGGSHDKGAEKPADTNQCHDITVYSALGLAAGACSGNGILLDIKDPVHPKRVDAVNDPNYSYWHSASFSNDGSKVVFTDEWGGGLGARCRPNDPNKWGADAIFRLQDDKLSLASYYKLPAAQGDTENCVAHNGSLIPVPGRDIEVQAWYQGGISIMDFTDAAHPFEIAYFDRGPIDGKTLILGGDWSAYWYNGTIYGSEIARGVDVFELTPTKFLTQNEINAAKSVHVAELNVQDQQKIEWPQQFVVAHAYVDQLTRSQALPADRLADLQKTLAKAEKSHGKPKSKDLAKRKSLADDLDKTATTTPNPADAKRLHALSEILTNPTA